MCNTVPTPWQVSVPRQSNAMKPRPWQLPAVCPIQFPLDKTTPNLLRCIQTCLSTIKLTICSPENPIHAERNLRPYQFTLYLTSVHENEPQNPTASFARGPKYRTHATYGPAKAPSNAKGMELNERASRGRSRGEKV
jgi:hypothetical protein